MFVKRITDKFILGLDMLRSYDTAMDLKNDMLQLYQDAITLFHPRAQSCHTLLTLASDGVIPTQCLSLLAAKMEGQLEVPNSLKKPCLKIFHRGVYIASTLVQARVYIGFQ